MFIIPSALHSVNMYLLKVMEPTTKSSHEIGQTFFKWQLDWFKRSLSKQKKCVRCILYVKTYKYAKTYCFGHLTNLISKFLRS